MCIYIVKRIYYADPMPCPLPVHLALYPTQLKPSRKTLLYSPNRHIRSCGVQRFSHSEFFGGLRSISSGSGSSISSGSSSRIKEGYETNCMKYNNIYMYMYM